MHGTMVMWKLEDSFVELVLPFYFFAYSRDKNIDQGAGEMGSVFKSTVFLVRRYFHLQVLWRLLDSRCCERSR